MLNMIKKLLPKPVKTGLIAIKQKTFDQYKNKQLFAQMQKKHVSMLQDLKGKKKVKVVFLAIHKSVWKVDSVFKKMLADPLFEPEILVCPYTVYGEERMQQDMDLAYDYFSAKGYPVKKAKMDNGEWVKLKDLQPDIVFFTNPHKLTREEYYENAYLNYLSCYVPYYFMATNHDGNDLSVLNTSFFMSMWKVYWASDYTKLLSEKITSSKGLNGFSFGYPAVEGLLQITDSKDANVWKNQEVSKKRIIYAPHHTIEENSNGLSSFILFGESIRDIAKANKSKIQWSFKPHPILKSKLYEHPSWGKEKTDEYYEFWKSQKYAQLDEGEYEQLFLTSDSMIHDCSSFIVEYAFTRNPCLYLVNKNNLKGLLNDFGHGVMEVYEQARTVKEIESFIHKLIHDTNITKTHKRAYFDAYLQKHYEKKLPSDNIVDDIKQSLGT